MREDLTASSSDQSGNAPASDGAARGYLRILIAEDDPINLKVLMAMLDSIPCDYEAVENGAEAIALLMRSPFDLVLMDNQMPVMDGITATREIRNLDGDVGKIPIIAVTAEAMQGDRQKFLDAGMNDYVSKPVSLDRLVEAINRSTGLDAATAAGRNSAVA